MITEQELFEWKKLSEKKAIMSGDTNHAEWEVDLELAYLARHAIPLLIKEVRRLRFGMTVNEQKTFDILINVLDYGKEEFDLSTRAHNLLGHLIKAEVLKDDV